jgi:hypothetical protein
MSEIANDYRNETVLSSMHVQYQGVPLEKEIELPKTVVAKEVPCRCAFGIDKATAPATTFDFDQACLTNN